MRAPEFRESLTADALDRDLARLGGSSLFEQWRRTVLREKDS
jgi:hypothetical protein